MGSFSNELELEILDHVFKVGSYTAATNLYVALCTSTVLDSNTGTTIAGELSGGAYARKRCNTWETASGGSTTNAIVLTFAQATADWGVVTHFAVCDHSSTGGVIVHGAVNTTKNVGSGDTAKYATNGIKVSLT